MTWSREQYLEMDARHREAMERAYAPWMAKQRETAARERAARIKRHHALCASLIEQRSAERERTRGELRRKILTEVADDHNIPVPAILGRSQSRPVSVARDEAFWRLRHELGLTMTQIGRIMDRDHSSVTVGIARHRSRMTAEWVAE